MTKYKNAASASAAKWARAHPERAKAYYDAARERARAFIQLLKAKPCLDCGGTFPPECMDFDHRDPLTKSYPGKNMMTVFRWRRKAGILKEVALCDVVCANCHRIRTAKMVRAGEHKKIAKARKLNQQ